MPFTVSKSSGVRRCAAQRLGSERGNRKTNNIFVFLSPKNTTLRNPCFHTHSAMARSRKAAVKAAVVAPTKKPSGRKAAVKAVKKPSGKVAAVPRPPRGEGRARAKARPLVPRPKAPKPAAEPARVAWKEINNWAMSGDDMHHRKNEGAWGTHAEPWLVIEEPGGAQVGLEFMDYKSLTEDFRGKVVTLPKGYKGALKMGASVLFSACHIDN